MNEEIENPVIQAMAKPSFYDHPVDQVERIETHISWIFLAGDFAYKIKKPVNFGFLDFSTLAKRRHYCLEELRLNQRFAPQLYLAVKPIGECSGAPCLDTQPALEYTVKMRRFPQNRQLDRMQSAGQLHTEHVLAFALMIAKLHRQALPVIANQPYGSPRSIIAPMLENFAQIDPFVETLDASAQLAELRQWTRHIFITLKETLRQRKAQGFIRECHGDAHLGNMAWFENQPLLFDCIEFNENLRWIDVINDIAFLVMDLDDRDETGLGWLFLNNYLQQTGDYQGLMLLNFYKVYRAMVRAKVTALRLAQGHLDDTLRSRTEQLFQSYLDLAEHYTLPRAPSMIITHGLSGSGKTTFAAQLSTELGAIHIRSDIERKRLYGIGATADSGSPVDGGIYSAEAFADTYNRLQQMAETILRADHHLIIDATFIKRHQREQFVHLATTLHVPLHILDFPLDEAELRRRIALRPQKPKADASEATTAVLDNQLAHQEPLTDNEKQFVIQIQPGTTVKQVTESLMNRYDKGSTGGA